MAESSPNRYEQFLLFPQCFQKTCTADTLKPGLVWERINRDEYILGIDVNAVFQHFLLFLQCFDILKRFLIQGLQNLIFHGKGVENFQSEGRVLSDIL